MIFLKLSFLHQPKRCGHENADLLIFSQVRYKQIPVFGPISVFHLSNATIDRLVYRDVKQPKRQAKTIEDNIDFLLSVHLANEEVPFTDLLNWTLTLQTVSAAKRKVSIYVYLYVVICCCCFFKTLERDICF